MWTSDAPGAEKVRQADLAAEAVAVRIDMGGEGYRTCAEERTTRGFRGRTLLG
jgi:hypothetical protein